MHRFVLRPSTSDRAARVGSADPRQPAARDPVALRNGLVPDERRPPRAVRRRQRRRRRVRRGLPARRRLRCSSPASFNAAALAVVLRQDGRGAVPIARGFEMATKTVFALMLPIGLGLALFAEPLIETLYGSDYGGAVTPLRLLGALVVLWGVNTTIVTVLVSRNRPDLYTVPALVALVPNLGLSVILIPPHGAEGAAIAAVAGAAVLTSLAVPRTARLFGPSRSCACCPRRWRQARRWPCARPPSPTSPGFSPRSSPPRPTRPRSSRSRESSPPATSPSTQPPYGARGASPGRRRGSRRRAAASFAHRE